ncbi:TPA: hypothetical protein JI121_16035 [Acinetobacter baumannii]|nr:hypothetical protein [Acinetobacter baumannii]
MLIVSFGTTYIAFFSCFFCWHSSSHFITSVARYLFIVPPSELKAGAGKGIPQGVLISQRELKQLEIEKLREGEGDEDPTPVKVTIQVVDASKKDAEHQSDAECASG